LRVPWIIDYEMVLEQMRSQQFKCHYFNSGAFGFPDPARTQTLAWIGPPDPTIRAAALPLTRPVPAPYESTLAKLACRLWQEHLPGKVWAMPMSHWAFELNHGSREWLPALVEHIDADPGLLEGRNNAAAIEFAPDERQPFEHFVERLLEMLSGSDFTLAFPGRPMLCTLHHHKQLWWTTTDPGLAKAVEEMVAAPAEHPAPAEKD
jgi:hypothetical protein